MNSAVLQESTGEIQRKQTLFEIGEELERIMSAYDLLVIQGGNADDELAKQLEAYFERAAGDLDRKIDAYIGLMDEKKARAEIRKREGNRLLGLAKADENLYARLRQRLHDFMEHTKNRRIDTTFHSVWLHGNGGPPPLVWIKTVDGEIVDTTEAPHHEDLDSRFVTVIPEQYAINEVEIRKALEAGEDLPFARLGDKGTHVRTA